MKIDHVWFHFFHFIFLKVYCMSLIVNLLLVYDPTISQIGVKDTQIACWRKRREKKNNKKIWEFTADNAIYDFTCNV